jgi:hypothetical protein
VKLPADEWDFSRCPADLIFECYCHEFGRSAYELSPWFREKIEAARREGKAVLALRMETAETPPKYITLYFDQDFAEKNFLSRKRYPVEFRDAPRPLEEIDVEIAPGAMRTEQSNREWFRERGSDEWRIPLDQPNPPEYYLRTRQAFYIDWNFSMTAIEKAMRQWLEKNKPKGHKPRHGQGRPGYIQEREADLRALGVWRLKRAGHRNDEIAGLKIRKEPGAKKVPVLVADLNEVTRLNARAEKILRIVFRVGVK